MAKSKISFGEIGNEVESKLSFKPEAEKFNGLCMANIESIELIQTEVPKVKEDGTPNQTEFAGKTVPSIKIVFTQHNFDATDTSVRYISLVEKVTGTKLTTGEDMALKTWESLVMAQFKRLQHCVNAMDKGGLLPKSKNCPAIDIEFGDTIDQRIIKMNKVYKHFIEQLVGKDEAKPKYADVKFWLVVVASNSNGFFYEIPQFIEKGVIEVYKKGVQPTIEVANKYSITLTKKPKKGETTGAKADMSYNDKDATTAASGAGKTAEEILAEMNIS